MVVEIVPGHGWHSLVSQVTRNCLVQHEDPMFWPPAPTRLPPVPATYCFSYTTFRNGDFITVCFEGLVVTFHEGDTHVVSNTPARGVPGDCILHHYEMLNAGDPQAFVCGRIRAERPPRQSSSCGSGDAAAGAGPSETGMPGGW
jgi:hypothetical protein